MPALDGPAWSVHCYHTLQARRWSGTTTLEVKDQMRRTLAALAAAAMLSAPMAAPPSEALAQTGQVGLVNVAVDNNNICVACDVAVAVQAIVQACDLVDVNQAQVLVLQALSSNVPVQVSDCDQDTGNQSLTISQTTEQRQGVTPGGGGGGMGHRP
jgi:hypothetical protein